MRLLQSVDILFIDDFAREVMTSWVILNIFNPILQHRIDNNMPTYITCNYSLTELFKIIEKNTDYVSADAIISRIKTIGNYNLQDKNYRLEK
jgi:primosomal protein DnaI